MAGKEYYEVLGVEVDASDAQINKPYHQKASETHTDKDHEDSEAARHDFQVLAEAYQVVSDPEKREEYDTYGQVEVVKDSTVDPTILFGMIFGNEIFVNYIGELTLYSLPPPEFDPALPPEVQKPKLKKILKAKRVEREDKLIKILKSRLEPYVNGQKADFVESAKSEANLLSQAAFGKAMLHTIGYIYTRQAAKEIGKRKYMRVPFLAEWVRDKRHSKSTQVAASQAAVSSIQLRTKWKMCNEERSDEINMKVAEEIKDALFYTMWRMNVADIEKTLCHVCQAVLRDSSVSGDILMSRARGLRKLGKIFQRALLNDH